MTGRPRVLTIIQARLASTRLPGKVLSPISRWPLLHYCVARCLIAGVGDVVVATTLRREDDALVALGQRLGIHVLRGPTDDVLSRFAEIVAARPDVDMVVRATADNPFVDIGSASRLLTAMGPTVDYAVEEGLPIGGTVEVMRAEALLRAHREATSDYDREHVTPWLKRADAGGALRLQAPLPCRAPSLRLTVDTLADLVTARHLADALTRAGWDPRLAPLPYVIASARAYMTQEVA